jgi:ActR/RegA family two-component response regulator
MGKSHRRYNELLDEYLKNPEKIDEAHAASTKKAEEQATNKKRAGILQNINWEQPIGKIAK